MATLLVTFKSSNSGTAMWINPRHVSSVQARQNDSSSGFDEVTIIQMDSGSAFSVDGAAADVVQQLESAVL